ncbi:substrate-binding domain-containing protein [Roseococcus sp. SDR]|uniref:substrate-binding domain-containing protein n=1 Tax=Roseococcus sp. SDR TaxID=2835532 RepID=UPI001BD08C0E|nr:substrate-binding domain-containing protein [Roseococcus sp. SDR]MBS7791403.1 substrate-binding domain-containing protein [Roseococcus sp. SDR]MBV1846717.1 substrate-binding domain-containing protein [Roseococcus sp. SDR]
MSQPFHILSTLAVAGLLKEWLPGQGAEVVFNPTARLMQQIAEGLTGDIAILTEAGIEELTAKGVLAAGTRRDLARSAIGMAVAPGTPHPDISTVEALRATLLATPSLVYSRAGASGIFFAELIERLGIAEEVNAKAIVIPQGFTAEVAARGEALLAIQQVSELMAVPGIEMVGKLPEGANTYAVFSTARFSAAQSGAQALLDRMAAAMTPERLAAHGLDPA